MILVLSSQIQQCPIPSYTCVILKYARSIKSFLYTSLVSISDLYYQKYLKQHNNHTMRWPLEHEKSNENEIIQKYN